MDDRRVCRVRDDTVAFNIKICALLTYKALLSKQKTGQYGAFDIIYNFTCF